MAYDKIQLYYFTGTGNSYRAASWMAETARTQNVPANMTSMDAVNPTQEGVAPGQLIGLFGPTHGFTAPFSMIRFALRLPKGNGTDAFVVLTRGGMMFGDLFIQGLEGSGAYLLALILALKGYRVRGVIGLDMPATWTVVMPGFSKPEAEAIKSHAKPRALAFFETMLRGETQFKGFIELAIGLALLPLSTMYLIMGRFMLAKLFYASDRCNACGLCARSCPLNAVVMRGNRPYWKMSCESCTRCMNFCPQQAVEASYPLGAAIIYAANLPLAGILLDWLARRFTTFAGWQGSIVEWVIDYPYKLLAFVVAYLLFWLLMRVQFVNRLVTLLTPTHYYRRYTEGDTKLKEIVRNSQ